MKHILMVDDNTTNLKVAASVLQPFYQLSMAKSGKQALTFLKKNKPDLILLDINMPEMNGYETLEEIKLDPKCSNIPVIFLTAANDMESEVKGMRMGALDYITKPFEQQVMLSRIEKVLQMEEMRKAFIDLSDDNALKDTTDIELMPEKISELLMSGDICLIYSDFDNFTNAFSDKNESFENDYINAYIYKLNEIFANGYIARSGRDGFVIAFLVNSDTDVVSYLKYVTDDCVKYASEKLGVNMLGCSAAAALSSKHGHDYASLFMACDKAMYYVKKTKDVNYIIYDGR